MLQSGRHYKIDTWTRLEGLPVNVILDLKQSPDGYLWATSYDGLFRFDGVTFDLFNRETLGLESNLVTRRMALDHDGTLWISSENYGLFTYKNGELKRFEYEGGFDANIIQVFCDSENQIWFSTLTNGLFKVEGSRFVQVSLPELPEDVLINTFFRLGDKHYLLGTENNGLIEVKDGEASTIPLSSDKRTKTILEIVRHADGRLWVGTRGGLYIGRGHSFNLVESTKDTLVESIGFEDTENAWLVTSNGLGHYQVSEGSFDLHRQIDGVDLRKISFEIMVDRENNIWMSTSNGVLIKAKKTGLAVIGEEDGLEGLSFFSVIPLDEQRLLATSLMGHMNVIEKGEIRPHSRGFHSQNRRVRHVMQDSRGRLWFSTYEGLYSMDPQGSGRWYKRDSGLPDSNVRVSLELPSGRILAGTRLKGLFTIEPDGSVGSFDTGGLLEDSLIMSLTLDSRGTLWVGTSGDGLLAVHADGHRQRWSMETGLISDIVFNTLIDSRGVVWVACNGGLSRIADGQVANYDSARGLASGSVYEVVEDSRGYLWLPGNNGIVRINKDRLNAFLDGRLENVDYQLFDSNNGFDTVFSPTGRIAKSASGKLYFSCMDGIALIDPANLVEDRGAPIMHITGATVDDQRTALAERVVVPPDSRRITLDFTGISLVVPEKMRFQHKLESYDRDWSNLDESRSASYTNLPPGEYTFKVRAKSYSGIWSETAAQKIVVHPGLLQKTWFRAAMIVMAGAVILGLYLFQTQRLKNRQKRLENTVDKRTLEVRQQARDLAEKNQELEAFSYSLSHDLKAPVHRIRGFTEILRDDYSDVLPEDAQLLVERVIRSTGQMHVMIEDMLTFAGINKLKREKEKVDLSRLARIILSQLQESEPERTARVEVEENMVVYADGSLMRILLENLLGNAWKFTHGREPTVLEVGRVFERGEAVFYIRDNGIGFDSDSAEKLFQPFERLHSHNEYQGTGIGLATVRRIIDRYNGRIWAVSKPGKGATFFFSLEGNDEGEV